MPLPRPTDVELRILDVFWDTGPSTVRQTHTRIVEQPDRAETSYSTTLRMIQVLHEKGFLTRDESVRPQVYRPTVSRGDSAVALGRSLAAAVRGRHDGSGAMRIAG